MHLLERVLIAMVLMGAEAAAMCSTADSCSGCNRDGDGNPVSGSQDCTWNGNECFRKDDLTHCEMGPEPVDTSHGDGCIPPDLNFDDPEWPMCKGGACVLRDEPEAAYNSMNIAAQMDVFGIPVLVDNTIAASERMFHLTMQSSILAQMLDDNQDGVPDDQNIVDFFNGTHALSPDAPWTGAGPKKKGFWVYNDRDSFTQPPEWKDTLYGARVYGITKETVREFMKAGCMSMGGGDGTGGTYMGMMYEETHHAFSLAWRHVYASQWGEQKAAALALWGNCTHGIECWPTDEWGQLDQCDGADQWNEAQCNGPRDNPVVNGNEATCDHGAKCFRDENFCKLLPNQCDGAYHNMEMYVLPGSDEGIWYGWALGTANLIWYEASSQQHPDNAGESTVWTKTQFDNNPHTTEMRAYFSPSNTSFPKTMQTRPHGFYNSDNPIDVKSCYGCYDTCGSRTATAVAGYSCADDSGENAASTPAPDSDGTPSDSGPDNTGGPNPAPTTTPDSDGTPSDSGPDNTGGPNPAPTTAPDIDGTPKSAGVTSLHWLLVAPLLVIFSVGQLS